MFAENYWAHISPEGTTPWSFIRAAGYNYIYAGENLAKGFTNSQDVINAWMASPSHRKNVLSGNYNNVGFSIQTGNLTGEETVLVVEMFGSTNNQQPVAAVSQGTTESTTQPTEEQASNPALLTQTKTETKTQTPPKVNENLVMGLSRAPVLNSNTLTKNLALIVISSLIFILALDLVFVKRRRIARVVGHNIDHILFFVLMILLIIIFTRGIVI